MRETRDELLSQDNKWELQKRKEKREKTMEGATVQSGEPVKRGVGSCQQGEDPLRHMS